MRLNYIELFYVFLLQFAAKTVRWGVATYDRPPTTAATHIQLWPGPLQGQPHATRTASKGDRSRPGRMQGRLGHKGQSPGPGLPPIGATAYGLGRPQGRSPVSKVVTSNCGGACQELYPCKGDRLRAEAAPAHGQGQPSSAQGRRRWPVVGG
ncbi:hypothetical protein BHM03_00050373 [Ensete ventricosum]|nr:hypothetical protein BHM03_00050373 [Ensete ventricosum]